MSTSDAWLLEYDDSLCIAVGYHQLVELVPAERCYPVPASPGYCSSVLLWQEHIVPVMDIGALHRPDGLDRPDSYLCLLNYQQVPGTPLQQLALRVRSAPQRVQVDDAQFCEFPRDCEDSLLRPVTLSCFVHETRPVLVLDIARLCSGEFRDFAAAA